MRPGSTGQSPVLKPKRALSAGRGIGQTGLRRLLDGFVLQPGIVDPTHHGVLDEGGRVGSEALGHEAVADALRLVGELDCARSNILSCVGTTP